MDTIHDKIEKGSTELWVLTIIKTIKQKQYHINIVVTFIIGILSLTKVIIYDYNIDQSNCLPNSMIVIEKINPNLDGIGSLCRLPNIGITTAQRIIDYREQWFQQHKTNSPFVAISDLMHVKGIGPKTISNLEHYITLNNIR